MHKTVIILDKLPRRLQSQAKSMLHEIWQANICISSEQAFDRFVIKFQGKHPKATDNLIADQELPLAFYYFPSAHWQHLKTTNPIDSTIATVRLRPARTRNFNIADSATVLRYQLAMSALKRWRRLRGFRQLVDVIAGMKFIDGIDEREISRKVAA